METVLCKFKPLTIHSTWLGGRKYVTLTSNGEFGITGEYVLSIQLIA